MKKFCRHFKDNEEKDQSSFTFYAIIVAVLGLFTITVLFAEIIISFRPNGLEKALFFMYSAIILLSFIWFFGSIYFLIKNLRNLGSSERSKLDYDKEWFWSFFSLLEIMAITWFVEIAEENSRSRYIEEYIIPIDLVKLHTSVNIFVIFVMKENVQLLISKKYRTFQRSVSTQSA